MKTKKTPSTTKSTKLQDNNSVITLYPGTQFPNEDVSLEDWIIKQDLSFFYLQEIYLTPKDKQDLRVKEIAKILQSMGPGHKQ